MRLFSYTEKNEFEQISRILSMLNLLKSTVKFSFNDYYFNKFTFLMFKLILFGSQMKKYNAITNNGYNEHFFVEKSF
jgi:hypothetical protein